MDGEVVVVGTAQRMKQRRDESVRIYKYEWLNISYSSLCTIYLLFYAALIQPASCL